MEIPTRSALIVLVLALMGCALNRLGGPDDKIIVGTITRVQERSEYEAPCLVAILHGSPEACEVPPACCAYRITVKTDSGSTSFMAFWPKHAVGLWVNEVGVFSVHKRALTRYPCARMYGCQYDVDYALDDDGDVRVS